MAEKIESYEFGRGRGKYPWEEWLDGNVWKATAGEDFDISAENFKASVYAAATKKRLKARVAVTEDGNVVWQAFPRDETDDGAH
jgi:hypothetical protein